MNSTLASARARPGGISSGMYWSATVPCGRVLALGDPVVLIDDTFYCKPCGDLLWTPPHVSRRELTFDRGGRCGGGSSLD